VAAAFPPLFALLLVYNVAGMVTMTLTTTLCLRHLPDADRHFPTVRLWGTVGWIASGLAVGVLIRAVSAEPLWLAAGVSLGLGLFALVLPATPPSGHRRSLADTLGLPAAGVFARGPLLVFAVCAVLATLLNSFYAFGFNKFLADLHLPSPTALQTIGQVSEVVFMALIPWALSRIGLKWLMVLGLAGWLLRYLVFLTESRPLIVLVGLPLHGFSHSFFFVAAMPFVDRNAPRHLRAGTQGMLTFLSMGLGLLPGNWLASEVIALCRLPSGVDWPRVWVVPAALALGTLALFAACFRVPARPAPIPEGIPAPGADGPVPVPPALEAGEPV
jgi:nucleoside transporter